MGRLAQAESHEPERARAKPRAPAAEAPQSRASAALATSLERDADTAAAAFDRDAPLAAGAIEPGPLRGETRAAAESTLGAPLGDVRVHTGPAAAADAQRLGATAFAFGSDVFVGGRGADDPSGQRRLLGHELQHVVQQRSLGTRLQLQPDPPPAPPQPQHRTVAEVLTADRAAFRPEYANLQQRYDQYRQTAAQPALPERWIRLARGSNRALLEQVLGPNIGPVVEPANPDEADLFRLDELRRPSSYSVEQEREDRELLLRYPGQLDARLGSIPLEQLQSGELSAGYLRIASGNVGEALAEPVLQMRLDQIRQSAPDAQIFRNVRMRVTVGDNADGSVQLSNPLLFSDGIIGRIVGSGQASAGLMLQILYVQEVKAGSQGGQEATEQTFTWIEGRIDDGARVVLEDGREFPYMPEAPGGVRGLMSAPRGIVAGRGVEQLGAGGAMGIAAPVERVALSRTPEEMRYLAGLLLQSIWARDQLRRLQQNARTPFVAQSTADFTNTAVVTKILTEQHNGLAVVGSRLYQLREAGEQLSITERAVVSLAFIYPPGTQPPQVPALPPGPPPPRLLGPGQPQQQPTGTPPIQPQLQPVPPAAPLLGPGSTARGSAEQPPTALPMPALGSSAEIARGAVPATGLGEWLPRVGGTEGTEWIVWNGRLRDGAGRPVTGFQDGEVWVRVIRAGGEPLPVYDPVTGELRAPAFSAMTREGRVTIQATPYEPPVAGPGLGISIGAGLLALFLLINELLTAVARVRDVQRQGTVRTQALIRLFSEVGADPRYEMRDVLQNRQAPRATEAEEGAFYDWFAPRIVSVDVAAFRERLPSRIEDFQALVLFLDGARTLGAIHQRGARYYLWRASPEYEITDTIEQIRAERLRGVDETMRADLAARGGQVMRLRSGNARVYRYSTGIPVRSANVFLSTSSWFRPVGSYTSFTGWTDRVHVEPANSEARAASLNAWYLVNEDIETVYREVTSAGRTIMSRDPADEREELDGFTAAPFPPELGATRYIRHYQLPRSFTIAIGEVRQLWIDRSDLEPVPQADVTAYAAGPPAAPAPSRFFRSDDLTAEDLEP